jgi:hypothetical protein
MDVFDVLAIVGALTGSIGAATQVYVAWRDREDLRLGFGFTHDEDRLLSSAHLDVLNAGRQPVALLDLGLWGGEFPITIQRPTGEEYGTMAAWKLKVVDQPLVLQQGEHRRIELPGERLVGAVINDGFHMDYPFRPFAATPKGWVWGEAGPFVRMIFPPLDERPPEIPAALWEPCDPPLRPARVEPRWKLWARRELRAGSRSRPNYRELQMRTGHLEDPE